MEKPNTAGSWVTVKGKKGACMHVCVVFFLITNGMCVRVCLCVRLLLCGLVSVVKFPLCCLGHIHLREFAARPYELKRLAAYAPLPDSDFWVCAFRLCPQSYFVCLLVNHLHYNFFFFFPPVWCETCRKKGTWCIRKYFRRGRDTFTFCSWL